MKNFQGKTVKTLLAVALMGCLAGTAWANNQFKDPTKNQLNALYATDTDKSVKYKVWDVDVNDDNIPDMIVKSNKRVGNFTDSFVMLGAKNGYKLTRYSLPDWQNKVFLLRTSKNGMRQLAFDDKFMTFSFGKNEKGQPGYFVTSSEVVPPQVATLTPDVKEKLVDMLAAKFSRWKKLAETDRKKALSLIPDTGDVYDLNNSGKYNAVIFPIPFSYNQKDINPAEAKEQQYAVAISRTDGYELDVLWSRDHLRVLKTVHNGWLDLYYGGTTRIYFQSGDAYQEIRPLPAKDITWEIVTAQ